MLARQHAMFVRVMSEEPAENREQRTKNKGAGAAGSRFEG
jgi:hypothetical protein